MAVPARRTSITKKRMRRTHLKKEANTIVLCPNCGEAIQPHRACTKCGYYKGKDVLNTKVEEVKEAPKKETKKATSKKKKETKKEA